MAEIYIYILFIAIEFVVIAFVSISNYLGDIADKSDATGRPHEELFSWYSLSREFGRAQTIGFGIGLLAFSLSSSFVALTPIKEALLSIGVGCLSAHFHAEIAGMIRNHLPEIIKSRLKSK